MLLPLLINEITSRSLLLRQAPFSLLLLLLAFFALYAHPLPTVVACVSAVAGHILLVAGPVYPWLLRPAEAYRLSLVLVLVCFLMALDRRRRRAAATLEAALSALRDNNHALTEAQQASKCASWTYDSTDKTRWHPGGYEVFGIPFSQVEQLASPILLIHPDDQARVRQTTLQMIATRGSLLTEFRVVVPNGELRWCESRGTPVPDKPTLWHGFTFDITDRKLAEAALIRSEKLAAMGRLASTVAHEVNNPLEAVTNLLYLVRQDRTMAPESQAYLTTAEAELSRLADITRLTLGFVRTGAGRREIEPARVLNDILAIYRHRCEMKSIRIESHYDQHVVVAIAPHELRQIATNLISNSIDALSRADCRIDVHVLLEESTAVLLFEDNGNGISPQNTTRVFEPFFTTKEDTGTGIGLWVTRELVEKNGGRITVESGDLADGMKTRFRIELPAVSSTVETGIAENEARPLQRISAQEVS